MKKILFSAIVISWLANCAATLHSSHGTLLFSTATDGMSAVQKSCFLPNAKNLVFTNITPTAVSFSWSPVEGAGYYRIVTIESTTKSFISSFLVVAKPSNNTATVIDLLPGGVYTFTVISVCANGQEGL